jgi:hypothetical protein
MKQALMPALPYIMHLLSRVGARERVQVRSCARRWQGSSDGCVDSASGSMGAVRGQRRAVWDSWHAWRTVAR